MASVAGEIRARLEAALAPEGLEIVDLSARHAGHAGARPDGETHFALTVVSRSFAGRSRIERHRLVNDLLAGLLRDRVHALSLTLLSPDEAGNVQRPPG